MRRSRKIDNIPGVPKAGTQGLLLPPPRNEGQKSGHRVNRDRKAKKTTDAAVTTIISMRLYIAGSAPNSVLATANLQAICEEYLNNIHKLEIIDILEQPLRALADGVLVTPSLFKLLPLPGANIVGNLSEKCKVLRALGIKRIAT